MLWKSNEIQTCHELVSGLYGNKLAVFSILLVSVLHVFVCSQVWWESSEEAAVSFQRLAHRGESDGCVRAAGEGHTTQQTTRTERESGQEGRNGHWPGMTTFKWWFFYSLWNIVIYLTLKGIVHQRKWSSVIYSLSSHFKPLWHTFFCGTWK